MVVISAVLETGFVWSLAELVNGLMVIPNLIALLILTPKLREQIRNYRKFREEQ